MKVSMISMLSVSGLGNPYTHPGAFLLFVPEKCGDKDKDLHSCPPKKAIRFP